MRIVRIWAGVSLSLCERINATTPAAGAQAGDVPLTNQVPPVFFALVMPTPGAATALYVRTVEKSACAPFCCVAATAITLENPAGYEGSLG